MKTLTNNTLISPVQRKLETLRNPNRVLPEIAPTTKPAPRLNFAEYEFFEGTLTKRVYKDGQEFSLFECDRRMEIEELAAEYWLECYDCEPTPYDRYVDEWAEFADDYETEGRRPVWIRCSFNSGEPYTLEVPSDAAVCESCDIVLGNYTADEIFAAFLKVTFNNNSIFSGDFESWSVFGLAYVKYYLEAIENKAVCFMPYCDEIWNEVYKELSK